MPLPSSVRFPPPASPVSRSRVLFAGPQLSARASWYGPGLHMRRHAHDCHQVSLLLCGTLGERGPADEVRLDVPAVGVKPAGLAHANDYGPAGALILGIELPATFDLPQVQGIAAAWQWRTRPAPSLLAQGGTLLADLLAGDAPERDAEARLWELLAMLAGSSHRPAGTRPRWVVHACQRLQEEAVPLALLAVEEGLHPVYFARAFTRWVGCPPSIYRMRAQLQRAMASIAAGQSLALAAQQAGLADQAHLNRIARRYCGLTPARLRALMA